MPSYLKLLTSIILFGLLFYLIDFSLLYKAFQNVTLELIIYLLLISVVLIYISSLKWALFVEATGEKVRVLKLFALYVMGYFINSFLPSFVGGDAVRSWYVGQKGERHNAFAATFMERYTGVLAMLALAILAIFSANLDIFIVLSVVAITVSVILFTIFCLKFNFGNKSSKITFINKALPFLAKMQIALKDFSVQPKLLTKTLLLSFLFHCFTVLNTYVAAYAVGWTNPPIVDLFIVLPLILIISFVPITPSGLGLQEGAFFFFLTQIGASPEQALGVGLILRAKQYLIAIFGGLVFMGLKKQY